MSQTVRWGILGAANINRDVIPAIQKSRRSQLVAIASRTRQKAEDQAREFNVAQAYEGYGMVLADREIDAVYIPLANHLHAEWTIKAVEAGKHVLCEKPLVLTLDEAEAVIKAARRTGKIVMEGFAYLHQAQTKKVRDILQAGMIGEVRVINGTFSFVFENMQDFRWTPEFGGGSLWDIGSYPVSYACWLHGLPVEVYGHKRLAPSGVDLSFAGQMHFADGAVSQFDCSFDQEFFLDMDIRGTQGRVRVDLDGDPRAPQTITVYRGGRVEQISVEPENQYGCQIRNMEEAILDKAAPHLSLEESLIFARTLTALHQSAQENRPVTVSR